VAVHARVLLLRRKPDLAPPRRVAHVVLAEHGRQEVGVAARDVAAVGGADGVVVEVGAQPILYPVLLSGLCNLPEG
jgi:hypothetical protein